jgi:hypothetical protein
MWDCVVLVFGTREIVGETSTRAERRAETVVEGGNLGLEILRGSD